MAQILIVEDHEDTRDIYRTIFEVGGHEVMEAEDGESGLELALSRHPDLVVLDLGLPGMDGWTVLERLREGEGSESARVLIVTAHGDQRTRQRSIRTSCDGLLIKPIEPRKLLEAAERCLLDEEVWPEGGQELSGG